MRLSYIHQAYGYYENVILCGGSNAGPTGRKSSAITARPGSCPLSKQQKTQEGRKKYEKSAKKSRNRLKRPLCKCLKMK